MALVRWDPFRALRHRDESFDDLFQELFGRGGAEAALEPAADVSETDGEVVVKLQVPGVTKDQLTVTATDDVLTVRGEIRKEQEEKKNAFYRQEIRYGAFERTLRLPAEVDGSRANAELKNGMVTITLPKSRQPKAHQVKIAVG